MANFPLTVQQFNDLHFVQGLSLSAIAKAHSIKVGWVSTWAKRNGIQITTKPTEASTITDEQIRQAVEERLSQRQIATKFGISDTLVCMKLKALGIKTNPLIVRKSPSIETKAKLSAAIKAKHQEPEYKAKHTAAMHSSTTIAKIKDNDIRLWQDPLYRQQHIEQLTSKGNQDKSRKAVSMDEYKSKMSKLIKEKWQEDEYKTSLQDIMQSPEYKAKHLASVTSVEYKDKMSALSQALWRDNDHRVKMAKIREGQGWSLTKPHVKVVEILKTLGIKHEIEYALSFFNFDVFLPDYKILIEVQGNYWHSLPDQVSRDKGKATYIEKYQPDLKLHYVWEHECLQPDKVLEKIKYWCGLTKLELVDFEFKDLTYGPVERKAGDDFLYSWHYQHHGRHGTDWGVYLGEILIALARFVSPTRLESAIALGYTPQQTLELSRLCVHPRYQKKNLLTWFLARVEKDIRSTRPEVRCLISFADKGQGHAGTIYKASNWTQHSIVAPSYHYIDKDGHILHKKSCWNHAKKMKMKESEYAEKYKFIKVRGQEKIKFIKIISAAGLVSSI